MGKARRWSKIARHWLLAHLPPGVLARPDELLIAVLCAISGAGAVAGAVDVDTVEALLPELVYRLWGVVLLLGALCLISGIFSIRQAASGYVVTRVPVYRLGQRLLFTGGLAYAACVSWLGGAPVFIASLLLFSLARGIRLLTIGGNGDHH